MAAPKPCTVCKTTPSLGVGVGKIKTTCAGCIERFVADGVCPACRGVDTFSPEHILVCDGKLPAEAKRVSTRAKKPKAEVKSPTEILKEVGASERMADRRAAAAARKKMNVEERLAYRKELEEQAAAAKAEGDKARLTKVQDKLAVENAAPLLACPECETFLDDRGRCANEGCVNEGQKVSA